MSLSLHTHNILSNFTCKRRHGRLLKPGRKGVGHLHPSKLRRVLSDRRTGWSKDLTGMSLRNGNGRRDEGPPRSQILVKTTVGCVGKGNKICSQLPKRNGSSITKGETSRPETSETDSECRCLHSRCRIGVGHSLVGLVTWQDRVSNFTSQCLYIKMVSFKRKRNNRTLLKVLFLLCL